MGRYDNYTNKANIKKAQKELDSLLKKKKQNLFAIDIARRKLEEAKLFESCQIFGREDFWKSNYNPNASIMFSDDNKVMWFLGDVIRYEDIVSYSFIGNKTKKTSTTTKKKGTISRAIVGDVLAGPVGAVVGAMSAGSQSETTYYETTNGFYLRIGLKDGKGWRCRVPGTGFFSDKIPRLWGELGMKLQMIIDSNQKDDMILDKVEKEE